MNTYNCLGILPRDVGSSGYSSLGNREARTQKLGSSVPPLISVLHQDQSLISLSKE